MKNIILNSIDSVSDIKNLKKLEFLNFDRNLITAIPNELLECENLIQMSFDGCSQLTSIPKTLLMMPNLTNASFRSCSLSELPSMVSPRIENLLFTGNHFLTCLPHEVMRFIDPQIKTSEFYRINENQLEALKSAQ